MKYCRRKMLLFVADFSLRQYFFAKTVAVYTINQMKNNKNGKNVDL